MTISEIVIKFEIHTVMEDIEEMFSNKWSNRLKVQQPSPRAGELAEMGVREPIDRLK